MDLRGEGAHDTYIGGGRTILLLVPSERHLRRHAVARTLFAPTTIAEAVERLGFVQADPIRAPARAQDLVLRHRVRGYREGDLERRYPELDVEEDLFVNYGFLPRSVASLLHPRGPHHRWGRAERTRAARLLAIVRDRGEVHPREVDDGRTVENAWGGTSKQTTHLLDQMHYAGMLRVARREGGVRVYTAAAPAGEGPSPRERAERLVTAAIGLYAPVPRRTLGRLVATLRRACRPLAAELDAAHGRLAASLPRARSLGVDWIWLEGDAPGDAEVDDRARLLAPFDPVVWDRDRFETLWGWTYRFEAYTPVAKRKLGYYALPLLYRDEVVGWANVGGGDVDVGYASPGARRRRGLTRALDEEIARLRAFLAARPALRARGDRQ